MFRYISIISIGVILLAILVVGLELAAVNSDPVTVNYLLGSGYWPLSVVIVCAFTAGVLFSLIIVLPLRLRLQRLRSAVADQANEIETLRKQPGSMSR